MLNFFKQLSGKNILEADGQSVGQSIIQVTIDANATFFNRFVVVAREVRKNSILQSISQLFHFRRGFSQFVLRHFTGNSKTCCKYGGLRACSLTLFMPRTLCLCLFVLFLFFVFCFFKL
jgi:hypothetical protein